MAFNTIPSKRNNRIIARLSLLSVSLGVCLHAGPTALAQQNTRTVTISHSDREAVNAPQILSAASNRFKVIGNSYQVRDIATQNGSIPATRPYFIFSLSSAGQGTVVDAKMRFKHPDGSFDGNVDDSETMTFFSVDRFSAQQLRALQTPVRPNGDPATPFSQSALNNLQQIFDDLGDGTNYGTLRASAANAGTFQTISLNSNARRDLTTAINQGKTEFILSGDLTSGSSSDAPHPFGTQERIFRGSDGTGGRAQPPIQLILTISDETPSSAPVLGGGLLGMALLGTGLAGVGLRRRRK